MRFLAIAAAFAACTIDARTEGSADASAPDLFQIAYTAPAAATQLNLCSNISGTWSCGATADGRALLWTGELDTARLQEAADAGGYIFNVSFDVTPFDALTQDGQGNFVEVGTLQVTGPFEDLVAEPVNNRRGGGNYWLHLQ